jgi:hypothetical protein
LSPFAVAGAQPVSAAAPPREKARRSPYVLAALTVLGVGALVWLQSSQRPVPSAEPQVTAALVAQRPQASVRCDRPLPPGSIRLPSGSTWPVERLCEAEASIARRAELSAALADANANAQAALEPPHPYYSVVVQAAPAQPTVQLKHASRARITVQLTGATCSAIAGVLLREAGSGGHLLGAAAERDIQNPCQRYVDLPFAHYGKRIAFQLEPSSYTASEVTFNGERIVVPVQELGSAPSKPRPSAKPPRPRPPRDCLPPAEFCR